MNRQVTELVFPATWRTESREVFQRLADLGKVDQADVDEAEARLAWFRVWRDYYATTGGKDVAQELQEQSA